MSETDKLHQLAEQIINYDFAQGRIDEAVAREFWSLAGAEINKDDLIERARVKLTKNQRNGKSNGMIHAGETQTEKTSERPVETYRDPALPQRLPH